MATGSDKNTTLALTNSQIPGYADIDVQVAVLPIPTGLTLLPDVLVVVTVTVGKDGVIMHNCIIGFHPSISPILKVVVLAKHVS